MALFEDPTHLLLRPPGHGLLTVSTGSEAAHDILGSHFGNALNAKRWPDQLRKRLKALGQNEAFSIIGIPSDSGGGISRGAAHGPLALRGRLYAKHPAWAEADLGDVPCIPQLVYDRMLSAAQLKACSAALWGGSQAGKFPVSPLDILALVLEHSWRRKVEFRPLILGGDHSISWAPFEALRRLGRLNQLAVFHVDAHTDLLESRFGIDLCFGTWTAQVMKFFPQPEAWVQVGIRASRKSKSHWQKTFGLKQHWAKDIRRQNPESFARELLAHWKRLGCERLYVTNDIDGTDGAEVPSTGTAEPGGLRSAWLARVLSIITRELPLLGADMVEVAPKLGSPAESRRTVNVAARYIEALNWV